jgi:hypothetical protein
VEEEEESVDMMKEAFNSEKTGREDGNESI